MASQTGKQTTTKYMLPNISRSNDSQTMKFSQLRQYNMRNSFLQKSYRDSGRKTSLRPFFAF